MGRVFKYPINLEFLNRDHFYIAMPAKARPLTFQLQRGVPTLWAEVDESEPPVKRLFIVKGTGFDLGRFAGVPYLGTVQLDEGFLVLHLFDGGEEEIAHVVEARKLLS